MNNLPRILTGVLALALIAQAAESRAVVADTHLPAANVAAQAHGFSELPGDGNGATQRGCMSLSEAVESIRRRGNVERVISAETQVSNGREVHVIKVLTTDGKVRTHRVPGCKRG